jgi:hypothetical protein
LLNLQGYHRVIPVFLDPFVIKKGSSESLLSPESPTSSINPPQFSQTIALLGALWYYAYAHISRADKYPQVAGM